MLDRLMRVKSLLDNTRNQMPRLSSCGLLLVTPRHGAEVRVCSPVQIRRAVIVAKANLALLGTRHHAKVRTCLKPSTH